ncbi:MAG: ACP S-malonyltransferase [Deltaproteobacteria bacterium]|nr:ACP S-malonyltransferase [Deltaproteobacteria bacterium]
MNDNGLLGLFPGQGAQAVGMGKDLHAASEIAQSIFATADKALGFSLSSICFEGPAEKLTSTAIAQPAILTMSTICFEMAKQNLPTLTLSAASGHSLGEYSALVAAGALKFEDAVVLVNKRGRYMQEAVPAGQGKMVAVLGKETSEIESALAKVSGAVAQIANINSPGQIVVAGSVAGVDEFLKHLGAAKAVPLPVSAPFHCSLMKPAEENLAKDLKHLDIKAATCPIFSNFSARALQSPEEIREALRLQVCGRVRWVECMENAVSQMSITTAVEFGPGAVLTGLLKRIKPEVKRINVNSLESTKLSLS